MRRVFHGPAQYALHDGSQDPGPAYAKFVHAGPALSPAERPRLLAAFNGGFLMRSRAGGYEQEFAIFGGFLQVRPDRVVVLAETADLADVRVRFQDG